MVIRGEGISFNVMGVWRFQGITSVKQVELLAIRADLHLAKSLGCDQIVVETDSMETMVACNGSSMDLSSLDFIATDIQELMSMGTISYIFEKL